MPRASLRVRSKSWELESTILLKKFFPQWKIDNSAGSFSRLYSNRFSPFTREAGARKRTGRWKTGSRCFQEAAVFHSPKTKVDSWEAFPPWWSFQARRTKQRRRHWSARGEIERSILPRIC